MKQSMKDDPVATCVKCGKSVGRIISAPAIMFKGSGWYVTDYSNKMKPPTSEPSDSATATKKDTKEAPASTSAAATTSSPTAPSGDGTATSAPTNSTSSSSGSSD